MCLVRVYLIKKKEANNLYKIIFIIGGERRKSFYRVLKRGETGLIRKKKRKKGFCHINMGPMGFKIFTVVPLQALFETQKQV